MGREGDDDIPRPRRAGCCVFSGACFDNVSGGRAATYFADSGDLAALGHHVVAIDSATAIVAAAPRPSAR
jgi:hypothetical protein